MVNQKEINYNYRQFGQRLTTAQLHEKVMAAAYSLIISGLPQQYYKPLWWYPVMVANFLKQKEKPPNIHL